MKNLFFFDSNPVAFIIVSLILLLFFVNLRAVTRVPDYVFLAFSCVTILVLRLPSILFNREAGIDESQIVGQAITLWRFPVFWKYVDGTTSGPLNSYMLFLGKLLTGNFDYTSARITGLILIIATVISIYSALKLLFDVRSARFSVTFLVLFYAYNQAENFIHISSEALPVTFMSFGLWLLALIWKRKDHFLTGFSFGFILSLVPFSKIQALPIAFFLGCFGLLLCGIFRSNRTVSGLLAGACSCLVLSALLMFSGGVWQDFWLYYIKGNLLYGDKISSGDLLQRVLLSLKWSEGFVILALLTVVFWAVSLRYSRSVRKMPLMQPFIAGYLLVTVFSIVKPGMFFPHYYLFLVPVIGFILANVFSSLLPAIDSLSFSRKRALWGGFVLIMGLNVWCFSYFNYGVLNRYSTNYDLPLNPAESEIAKYIQPGDFLAIWGWWPAGYVHTQTIQAAAENHPVRAFMDNELTPFYIDRFIADIDRSKPAVFADPVGSSYHFSGVHHSDYFEAIPKVKAYIDQYYVQVNSVENVRIFLRKDRLPPSDSLGVYSQVN